MEFDKYKFWNYLVGGIGLPTLMITYFDKTNSMFERTFCLILAIIAVFVFSIDITNKSKSSN